MAKILGLDLGTNSIGWAVVDNEKQCIEAAGSRIIPMDAGTIGDYEKGNSVSQTKERTQYRGMRRLRERQLLRRERLHRVLKIMQFLPEHYASQLTRYGQIPADKEPKLAWKEGKNGKPEFIFKESFNEMLQDFRKHQPTLTASGKKIPYDWTIYYLRNKALSQAISKEELAWILLQFNQKRGYNQLRGETEENGQGDNKMKEFVELTVIAIEEGEGKTKGNEKWYNIELENGWVYKRKSNQPLDWVGKKRKFIATHKTDSEGNIISQHPSLSSPSEDDWGLIKLKTENDIKKSQKTPGAYIYRQLLNNPNQKIIGELVRTIDRTHYLQEIHAILEKQKEFIPELNDRKLYEACITELYANNHAYRNSIAKRSFTYLLADDILFYQRPLKSKKHLIANCPYETRCYVNKETGECIKVPIKCISKSHPAFQEFRLWQFLSNLKIFKENADITAQLLPNEESWARLFDHLIETESVSQKDILKYFKIGKKEEGLYRWNYVEDKSYPCGETRHKLLKGLSKCGIDASFLDTTTEETLWHILYSIDTPTEYKKALQTFAQKQNWDSELTERFTSAFEKLTVCSSKEYGSYSHKAIKRLLPAMRRGHHWSADQFDEATRNRIATLKEQPTPITDGNNNRLQKDILLNNTQSIEQCSGMSTWQACYLVYGRHSESNECQKWHSPDDIDIYLNNFRQHSLNNPIVEQVITETLRTVRDIWKQSGSIDEIHIELGRELKQTKLQREIQTRQNQRNEENNKRIRMLLSELMNPEDELQVENVRPHSPSQMELLKLYEEGVYNQADEEIYKNDEEKTEIQSIYNKLSSDKNRPTPKEIKRYKIWLSQKYISPYTGKQIPLGKLFTSAYEIEHIIPQSRFFDDSMSNKVICEAEVNKLKDRQLGFEFIKNHAGEEITLSMGGKVRILSAESYEALVKRIFKDNPKKQEKLMLEDIPETFIARQLNDSRYISKLVMQLLSNIVRTEDEEGNKETSVNSKNVIACNGAITDRLKQDWGINDVWNRIILPRFERLNRITDSSAYTAQTANGHTIPNVPAELRGRFQKKRLDHRHHAMDAIVIACTTRDHVNLMNNQSADSNEQYGLQHKLRHFEPYTGKDGKVHRRADKFIKPWDTFTQDTFETLNNIVVSFKQNLRVVNNTSNYYTAYTDGKKKSIKQQSGDSLSIRKPMHKDTVYGEVNLKLKKHIKIKDAIATPDRIVDRQIKEKVKEKLALHYTTKDIVAFFTNNKDVWSDMSDGKVEVYYYTNETKNKYFASRKALIDLMKDVSTREAAIKTITSITDTGIQKILRAHLLAEGNDAAQAFSADGIERMNLNITNLNGGKPHKPIKRVRQYEQANKFAVGSTGNKGTKFVEAAKGTNLYYAIYVDNKGNRGYATIPLNIVIDLQKQYSSEWNKHLAEALQDKNVALMPDNTEILYILSPGDLVYVPTETERKQGVIQQIDLDRTYKVVSMTGKQLHCIPHTVASIIKDKTEYDALNKISRALSGEMINEVCIPLKIDRLGNITI